MKFIKNYIFCVGNEFRQKIINAYTKLLHTKVKKDTIQHKIAIMG